MESVENLAEKLLVRLEERPARRYPLSDLRQLTPELADSSLFDGVLEHLRQQGEIAVKGDQTIELTTKSLGVGVKRLVRKFCRRYYGEVSPLVDEKLLQAVLKRHGASYELRDDAVQQRLAELEVEGLIRVVKKPNGYIKMLGAG